MGVHRVVAACPRCGVIELIFVSVGTVLSTPSDDNPPSLRVKTKAKAVEHDCGSTPASPATLFDDVPAPAPDPKRSLFDH